MPTPHPLQRLFRPRHVALLGVSLDRNKAGYKFLRSLIEAGFAGRISLLGRQAGEIDGLQIYTDPADLPADIDVVINLLGPAQTPEVLEAVAARGAAFAVVFTAGFAEMGEEGERLQTAMVRNCNARGMRIVGPNCMGLFNLHIGLNLTEIAALPIGNVALISQSGNVAVTLWDQARKHDLGFSSFVGFGNQADIPIHEYIDYLGQDDETRAIAIYLEGLRPQSGDAFFETCARVSRTKPIVVLKGGRKSAGRRAAQSHTASLTSSERVYQALFAEAGVVEVRELEHLLPAAEALMRCPPMRGEEVAIVGSGGGHSIVCTDEVEAVGLSVPEFPASLVETLSGMLPSWAPKKNPVDMTGAYINDPSLFSSLTELVMQACPSFDAAVNYGLYGLWKGGELGKNSPHDYTSAAPLLGRLQAKLGKPLVFYTPYADRPHPAFTAMRESGVPCLESVELVGVALAALRQRGRYLARAAEVPPQRVAGEPIPAAASRDYASEVDAYRLLARHGVTLPEVLMAETPEGAAAHAERIGYPVVVKAILPGVAHKSDVGGVRTGLGDAAAVRDAAQSIAQKVAQACGPDALAGFTVMRDFGRRRELIAGVRRDPSLTTLGLVGLGGVLAEAFNDVAVVLLPATPERVSRALARLNSASAWGEFRGELAVDAGALATLLNQLDAALSSDPVIDSIECNPVMVVGRDLVPVDAAIAVTTEDQK